MDIGFHTKTVDVSESLAQVLGVKDSDGMVYEDAGNVKPEALAAKEAAEAAAYIAASYGAGEMQSAFSEAIGYGAITGLSVSAQNTLDMTVQVEGGKIHMTSGKRFVIAAITALTLAAADEALPRVDSVYVNSSGSVVYAQGTATTNQGAPALPTGAVKLAEISVPAGITSIADDDITNKDYVKTRYQNLAIVNPIDFGVVGDGVTDDTKALQRAINFAAKNNLPIVGRSDLVCLVSSTIVIPPTINADFKDLIITPSISMKNGYVVVFSGLQSSKSMFPTILNLRVWKDIGTRKADVSSNLDGISFGSVSLSAIRGLDVRGFRDGVAFNGPDCYINKIEHSHIGRNWRRNVAVYAHSNSNENYTFVGCAITDCNNPSFNGTGFYIDPASSTVDVHFFGCSFDYNDLSIDMYHSNVDCFGCHFENNTNNPHVNITSTPGKEKPSFKMFGGNLGGGPGITSWTGISVENNAGRPSYIVSNNGSANIEIKGVKCGGYNTVDQNTEIVTCITAGDRRIVLEPIIDAATAGSVPLPPSYAKNCIYVSKIDLSGWAQNGSTGTTLSFDSTNYYSPDVGSRKCVSTAGNSFSLTQKIPVISGQTIIAKAYVNVSAITNGYVSLRYNFFAPDGTTVIATGVSNTVNAVTSDWVPAWLYLQVPPGATSFQFMDYFSGFTGTAYISNEHVWVF